MIRQQQTSEQLWEAFLNRCQGNIKAQIWQSDVADSFWRYVFGTFSKQTSFTRVNVSSILNCLRKIPGCGYCRKTTQGAFACYSNDRCIQKLMANCLNSVCIWWIELPTYLSAGNWSISPYLLSPALLIGALVWLIQGVKGCVWGLALCSGASALPIFSLPPL